MAAVKIRATFNFADQQRLMKLVLKYAGIIESKKTDKHTWQQKEAAWKELANEFNSGSTAPKNYKALILKFRNMKREYRAIVAKDRQSIYATGGGPQEVGTPYPFSDSMEQLVELSAKGMDNPYDSDVIKHQETSKEKNAATATELDPEDEDNPTMELNDPMEDDNADQVMFEGYVPVVEEQNYSTVQVQKQQDWGQHSPAMLKKPIHEALVVLKEFTPTGSICIAEHLNEASSSAVKRIPQNKSAGGKPNVFKAGNKRPSLKAFHEQKRSASTTKFTALAETKKELAEHQINLVKRELEMKTQKNALKMELLKMKIEAQDEDFDKRKKEMELLNLRVEVEKMALKIKQLEYSKVTNSEVPP